MSNGKRRVKESDLPGTPQTPYKPSQQPPAKQRPAQPPSKAPPQKRDR